MPGISSKLELSCENISCLHVSVYKGVIVAICFVSHPRSPDLVPEAEWRVVIWGYAAITTRNKHRRPGVRQIVFI